MSPLWHSVIDAQSGEKFSIVRCCECGLGVTTSPSDASDKLDSLDRYYGEQYVGGRHGFTASMCDRRRIRIIDRCVPGIQRPKLLDVGCGDGTLIAEAIRRGYRATGVERFSGVAADAGLPVRSSLRDAGQDAPHDCITMWHVLEHLTDLDDTITQVRKLISDDGVLIIAVPDFGSLPAKVFGRFWLHVDVPRHRFHFTDASLTRLLSRHRFSIDRYRGSEIEYDVMGWSGSLQNAIRWEPNLFFKLITGRTTRSGKLIQFASLILGTIFSAVVALPVLIAGWCGHGGTLILVCRPMVSPVRLDAETLEGRIV